MGRCTRCILPETYPGIKFDSDGVCNVCHDWHLPPVLGEAALRELLSRRKGDQYDAVVGISGGRDSMYALWLVVKVLGLRVVAASFHNGFRTPQAQHNMEAGCAALDVPFVDILEGRELARKIVKASLEYYIPRGPQEVNTHICGACTMGARGGVVKEALKVGAPYIILGSSKTEALTEGYKNVLKAERGRLAKLFGKNGLAYLSRVFHLHSLRTKMTPGRKKFGFRPLDLSKLPVKIVRIFDYIEWDKNVIEGTIRKEMGWSEPEGANRSWRIDCDIEHLNQYCSTRACGVTTIEVGYSNMIREGSMTRSEAIHSVRKMKLEEYSPELDSLLDDLEIPVHLKDQLRDYPQEYEVN